MRQFTVKPSYWLYWLLRIPKVIRWFRKNNSEFKTDKAVAEVKNDKRFSQVKRQFVCPL